jgi:ornithine cyclodeaminase/alanine dehydrogenase-like protein (mu-crystallin family)
MNLLALSADDLRRALPMDATISAMKDAFAALSTGEARMPVRSAVPVEPVDGVALLMGAYLPEGTSTDVSLAAKVVSVFHRNDTLGKPVVNGVLLILDPNTGEPTALCDGGFLTAWRTGAATGAATDLLARSDAKTGAVIGCGEQARTQVLGIDAVRTLRTIRVHGRRGERVRALIDEVQPRCRAALVAAGSPAEAVRGADVVCAATNSRTPVFPGDALAGGAHVNGIGSFTLEMRELDETTVDRAKIFVDSVPAALEEAGELVHALREGRTKKEEWTELGLVVAGQAEGRQRPDEITLFKSVGQAVQDAAAGALALRRARESGLGRMVRL